MRVGHVFDMLFHSLAPNLGFTDVKLVWYCDIAGKTITCEFILAMNTGTL